LEELRSGPEPRRGDSQYAPLPRRSAGEASIGATLQHSTAGQVDNASARGGRSGAQSADKRPDKSDEKDADKSGKKEDNKSETPPEAKEESKPEDPCDPKKLLFSFDERIRLCKELGIKLGLTETSEVLAN
jgi:hypothetical protein